MAEIEPLLSQSLQDLTEDLELFASLAATGTSRLLEFHSLLTGRSSPFPKETRETLLKTLPDLIEQHQTISRTLREGLHASNTKDEKTYHQKLDLKKHTANELRTLQLLSAAMRNGGDSQSPSYDHTLYSRAGRETGQIRANSNDYKRDHHGDAEIYERHFVRSYINHGLRRATHAFATVSGMAAFATAIACVQKKTDPESIVLAGEGSYFENKRVLREWLQKRVRFIDEMNTQEILTRVREDKPGAIFLDTLGNTPALTVPDLKRLIPELSRLVTQPTYLVLDNSARATTFQALPLLPLFSKLELIVIESLNKYYQYGFDRVTGGILWTNGLLADYPFRTRMHLGTNIPDTSALALAEPNRKFLDRRLARIGRNTLQLAQSIESHLATLKNSPLSHVVYPGLPSYPGFAWTKDETFHGGCLVLAFKEKYRDPVTYAKFVALVMKIAKKRKIDLIAGSSFGLDTTRVYLTARGANTGDGEPFVRISPGTETRLEMEEIEKLFNETIEKF